MRQRGKAKETGSRAWLWGCTGGFFALLIGSCLGGLWGFLANRPISAEQTITVTANAAIAPYIEAAADQFNQSQPRLADGQRFAVAVVAQEAGAFVSNLTDQAAESPTLWLPDAPVWVELANETTQAYRTTSCVTVAQSPLVLGMWRDLAQLLGYPGRDLGWLDIASLTADPSAWAYYTGGDRYNERLRVGQTHPGLSGAGASTLLAVVQAAQKSAEPITPSQIEQPIVQASLTAFEGGVTWFSKDVQTLATTMMERGTRFLGVSVMYENNLLTANQGDYDDKLVAVYPFEGTLMATHPACINQGASPTQQEGAQLFRDFLLSETGQALAVDYFGLRSADLSQLPVGVSAEQKVTLFPDPSVGALQTVQRAWQVARRPIHIVMAIDSSGSMSGEKIEAMKVAARQFVLQMGDGDYLSLIEFASEPSILAEYVAIEGQKQTLADRVSGLRATGDTALYDAMGLGAELIAQYHRQDVTNALVLLSDGKDTNSSRFRLDDRLFAMMGQNDTTVFTIAYGSDADESTLERLANEAFGVAYSGDSADIGAIYEDLSAAFGGSAGIGR